MSTIPGYKLEDYICDALRISCENKGHGGFYVSSQRAGLTNGRPPVNEDTFRKLVELWEPHREKIEDLLLDFTEEEYGSWRDYKYLVVNERLTDELFEKSQRILEAED